MRQAYNDVEAYITKDGSEIRELMHPSDQGSRAHPSSAVRERIFGSSAGASLVETTG